MNMEKTIEKDIRIALLTSLAVCLGFFVIGNEFSGLNYDVRGLDTLFYTLGYVSAGAFVGIRIGAEVYEKSARENEQ